VFEAVRVRSIEVLAMLLEAGASICGTTFTGENVIHAFMNGNSKGLEQDVLEILIQYGAQTLLNIPNRFGQLPILFAICDGNHNALDVLIRAGADITL
jgi:ankyrin repeat protein